MRAGVRRRTVLIAGGVAVLVAVALTAHLSRESPVGRSAYHRIWVGMPTAEAAAAYPPSRYLVSSDEVFVVKESEGVVADRLDVGTKRVLGPGTMEFADKDTGEVVTIRGWVDGNSMIYVHERNGRIAARAYCESMPGYELWLRRLLQRMGF